MRSEPMILNPAGRTAIKAFRDSKPWKGTLAERGDKFSELHRGLTRAYDLETILVRDDSEPDEPSGASRFSPTTNKIILRGRLSAVTYLFCFALACGVNRVAALQWARETFRHFFPRSFGGCRDQGGLLVRDQAMRN